jgi:hypothetical protein
MKKNKDEALRRICKLRYVTVFPFMSKKLQRSGFKLKVFSFVRESQGLARITEVKQH